MERRDEEPGETADRRSWGTALRFNGAVLASVLALGVPMDGSGGVSAGEPILTTPARLPGSSVLPSGWPGDVPELKTPLELDVWTVVHAACQRHGIADEALTMYQVLWEESRLTPQVRSSCGRYHGIGQFTLSTFFSNVEAMQHLGLIWGDEEWSPLNPDQAIEVMAWMWSRRYHDHWGPYRRVVRRLAATAAATRLN